MSDSTTLHPKPKDSAPEIRTALLLAGLMLVAAFVARLAPRFGWTDADTVPERALMLLLAVYLVLTGNTIPKRLTSLVCARMDAARTQSFFRFAGWTWVLTGLAFGVAWVGLPLATARVATLVVVPLAIAAIAFRWFRLAADPPPTT